MINNSNVINRYDDLLYESKPSSLNEFLSNKYNNVHDELYQDALNNYIHSISDEFINSHLIYEFYKLITNIEYNEFNSIDFDDLYKNILIYTDDSPIINDMLDKLSINRYDFFKEFYTIISNKINNIKETLNDIQNNTDDTIKEILQLCNIKDFRYMSLSLISNENNDNNYLYTLQFDENNNTFITDNIIVNNDDPYTLIHSDNNYLLLMEYNDARITYDKNGKLTVIINNNEHNWDVNNIKTFIDNYMNYETNNIINEYKDAICKLYKSYHKIIEIKNSEYWMPSHIRIINKIAPYKKITVDLKDYWNDSQNNEQYDINDIRISNENILDSELIELNYVKGKARLSSRNTDIEYEVPFKYLNENVNVSDDMILSNTFINKYINR